MGRLTTHVLDTALGRPAAGLRIDLFRHGETEQLLATVHTNEDGRVDHPLLEGSEFRSGTYELRFDVAAYHEQTRRPDSPAFYGVVPVRFEVADPALHYHVPLLISPFGYSTYRGS